ncbi:LysR family transcriptional regulator [Pseudoalteromonas sp. HM-SA03]|uniref:helix-turn-helix domain-containing protein n=1 Tax=Pseudoalteromonas sp. HM-SA03 TaxID=2029678 RepID=UPI0020D05A37|nr:LysR family transcriptional regulator [Pseudoalteromonas sp. HM-SA03]
MENWDDFQLLLALKRANTLRGAAKVLGVNHTTVSRRLHALNQRFSLNICMLSQGKVSFLNWDCSCSGPLKTWKPALPPHLSQINTSVKQLKQQINLSIPQQFCSLSC